MKAESEWPRDTHDYVFLARAVDQIGQAMFPGEWTGKELTAPDDAGNKRIEKVHASILPAIEARQFELRGRLQGTTVNQFYGIPSRARTPEGWIEALSTFEIELLDASSKRKVPALFWLFVRQRSLQRLIASKATEPSGSGSAKPAESTPAKARAAGASPDTVKKFVKGQFSNGRRPSMFAVETAWLKDHRGRRPEVRAEYHAYKGALAEAVEIGRPRKGNLPK